MEQKLIEGPIKGYKATDGNMQCRGVQFEIGKTFTLDNDKPLKECNNGFHFCKYPSGVWSYYTEMDTRVFEVECYDVLVTPEIPGSDYKQVCRKIKFIKEINVTGDRNTGYRNTGDRNTGYCNTGDYNTGYCNTGDWNITDRSCGLFNTKERLYMFDRVCNVKYDDIDHELAYDLGKACESDEQFDVTPFLELPNATEERIKAYHKKAIEARKKLRSR